MNLQLRGRVIFFATNNVNKFNEARRILAEYEIATGMLRVKSLEIQSESLEEIAKASVADAFKKCHLPVVVEDAGLFTEALGGFPGPYAAYVYKTIGNEGLLRLVEGVKVRRAKFESIVAYLSGELESPMCFGGVALGELVTKERRGDSISGFGFDPIFRPASSERTFAEMSVAEKNQYSHRSNAFRKFGQWYRRLALQKG
jgi:XTP/dITP diphosphohydrolase